MTSWTWRRDEDAIPITLRSAQGIPGSSVVNLWVRLTLRNELHVSQWRPSCGARGVVTRDLVRGKKDVGLEETLQICAE